MFVKKGPFDKLEKKDFDFVVIDPTRVEKLNKDCVIALFKKKNFIFVSGTFLVDFVSRPNHKKPNIPDYQIIW